MSEAEPGSKPATQHPNEGDVDELDPEDVVDEPEDPQNHREHPRFELTAYVDYTGNEVLLYHHVDNISLGGLALRTSAMEEMGTRVELLISFPDQGTSIAVEGEVAWANHEPPMDMGIRFVGLDDERRGVLRDYLQAVRRPKR